MEHSLEKFKKQGQKLLLRKNITPLMNYNSPYFEKQIAALLPAFIHLFVFSYRYLLQLKPHLVHLFEQTWCQFIIRGISYHCIHIAVRTPCRSVSFNLLNHYNFRGIEYPATMIATTLLRFDYLRLVMNRTFMQ